jgi:nitronate monooxygenase
MLSYGAIGVSVGSPFIASIESGFQGIQTSLCWLWCEDIVLTEKISGTPCTVINTPYIQKWEQTWLERTLNKNKTWKSG